MWKTICDVIGQTKNNTHIKEIVSSDGESLTDKKLIANEFNQYFNTKPTNTLSDLDPSLHSYDNLVTYQRTVNVYETVVTNRNCKCYYPTI